MEKDKPGLIEIRSRDELLALSQVLTSEEAEHKRQPEGKPSLTPGPSDEGFAIGLYQEHLEEISFLFGQCKALFLDPEITWPEVEELEERLLAHVDAIELGGDLAIRCAQGFLESDDEEEVRGAAYVLAVVGNSQIFGEMLKVMGRAGEEIIPCFADALKYAPCRGGMADRLLPLLSHSRPEIRAAAVEILGCRREGQAAHLIPLLQDASATVVAAAADALGLVQSKEAVPCLEPCLARQDPAVQHAAALALLRMGHLPALEHLAALCQPQALCAQWAVAARYLALAGRADALNLLVRCGHKNRHLMPDIVSALGILGNGQAVEILIDELKGEDEALKVAAGEALELITGAGLREKAALVEAADPDEMLEGEAPPEPAVQEIERVCTSAAEWTSWWYKNRSRFQPAVRWRFGKPFDFGLCIDEMVSPDAKYADRQRAYREVVIRSGHDFPFEPDWPVSRQREALHRWQTWWQGNSTKFSPGKWYFNGREI